MKHFCFLICTFFFALSAGAQGYSELYAGEEASSLRELADSISALKGEEAVAAFVSEHFRADSIELFESSVDTQFGIRRENGDTATFHNVVAWIPGYDKQLRENYLVIGTRLDPSNGSGLATLMQLARKLNTNQVMLRRSIIVAAFGGAEEANAGSWYFVNRSFPDIDKIDSYVGVDFFDTPNRGLFAFSASNADINGTIRRLSETLQPAKPVITNMEPAVADHRSFFAKEIPSVLFTTVEPGKLYRPGTDPLEYEEMNRQCEYLYNFCLTMANGVAPEFNATAEDGQTPLVGFNDCDTKPRFFGSSDPSAFLRRWVYVYLKYPEYAVDNGISGRVLVSFVIDEKGKVGSVKVEKGVHPSLDNEAVRVIEASPDWKAGLVNGKPVRTRLSLYVEFKLKKAKK